MTARLAAGIEAAALLRRAEALGGNGVVLQRGDAQRGSLLLQISERGCPVALLERMLGPDGEYRWQHSGPAQAGDSSELARWVDRRRGFDPDLWVLELDIASAQPFIAETIGEG